MSDGSRPFVRGDKLVSLDGTRFVVVVKDEVDGFFYGKKWPRLDVVSRLKSAGYRRVGAELERVWVVDESTLS